ncbi:MAG: hypothetical protein JNM17_39275 [Archangium sp.]|nr:hypothetical protein [Archangium sp.]
MKILRRVLLVALAALPSFAADKPAEKPPVRIAVLYFDVLTQDAELQAFTKGLAAMMITDLAMAPGLQIVERDRLEAVLAELKLGSSAFTDKSNLVKVGKLLQADFLVTGSLIKAGKIQSIELRLFSSATSAVTATHRAKLKDDDVFEAEQSCVGAVLKSLDKMKSELAVKSEPLPYATAVKYSYALDAKDKKDKATATRLLQEVVKERPGFALAKLDLATLTE